MSHLKTDAAIEDGGKSETKRQSASQDLHVLELRLVGGLEERKLPKLDEQQHRAAHVVTSVAANLWLAKRLRDFFSKCRSPIFSIFIASSFHTRYSNRIPDVIVCENDVEIAMFQFERSDVEIAMFQFQKGLIDVMEFSTGIREIIWNTVFCITEKLADRHAGRSPPL